VLGPFRRIIPPVGMIDISPIVVFFALGILRQAICG
jgi:YggT family protein